MSNVLTLHNAHVPELKARKASIEVTLAALSQLSLYTTQKEAELAWVKAIQQDAETLGLTIDQEDSENRAALIQKLEEALLALQEQRDTTAALSQALQEAFTLHLGMRYGINISSERWELDLETQVLRKVETSSNEGG